MKRFTLFVLAALLLAGLPAALAYDINKDFVKPAIMANIDRIPAQYRAAVIASLDAPKGWQRSEMLNQNWTGSGYEDDQRATYHYNGDGTIHLERDYMWQSTMWIEFMNWLYAYGASADTITISLNQGVWMDYMRLIYTYDGNHLPIELRLQTNSSGWLDIQRSIITWDGAGHITGFLQQAWTGASWLDRVRSTLTYDGSWRRTQELQQAWKVVQQTWVDTVRTTNTFAVNDSVATETKELWVTSAWVNNHQQANDWSGPRLTDRVEQSWSGSAWTNESREQYTYDGNLNLYLVYYYYWGGSDWSLDERDIYTYTQGVVGSDLRGAGGAMALYSSPNPTRGSSIIRYATRHDGPVKLEVYNAAGQLVRTLVDGHQTAGMHQASWNGMNGDGRKATSGLYVYKLVTPEGTSVNKLILTK